MTLLQQVQADLRQDRDDEENVATISLLWCNENAMEFHFRMAGREWAGRVYDGQLIAGSLRPCEC